jgi:two-component system, cell cycle sensor histidine kinase and response regulator CckA
MRVLIADDETSSRSLLRMSLAAQGHQVMEAGNGVEALSALKAARFDAVISDILMPDMDGYRLCHEIRKDEKLRNLPVVIYSSTYTAPEEDVALRMGASRFLRKPAPAVAILAALEEAASQPVSQPTLSPAAEGVDVLKRYSERLVQRLEHRNVQLETAREELARSNAELLKSAAQVRLLLDSTAEGVYGLDLEGRFTFVNFACVSMLGYQSADDLLGKVAHDLIHHSRPDGTTCPGEECAIFRALGDGREASSETAVLWRADGTSLIAAHRNHPVLQGGRPVGSVVTFLDITEREQAERDRRRSEERFRRLFDSNTIGIAIADLDGVTLEANAAYVGMLGYSREELIDGKIRWNDLTPPEHRDRDRQALEELRTTGVSHPWEKEMLRRDGTRLPVLLGVAMLEASEGTCIAYFVDLSKSRNLEDQLREAQKMEAVGLLAGGVAHDFNNLLTVVLGHSELLLQRFPPGDETRDGLIEIRQAGERAGTLTRQLLALSRRQILQPAVINLNDIVTELEKMLRRLIREDIHFDLSLDRRIGRVRADPGQIEQVIMNLVVNARDAMPEGGRITIETRNFELDAAYATRHIEVVPGNYVMVAVSDTGTGMTAETRARIFEPFFTTKGPGKGTGLGLSTAHGIVTQSGGSIEVYAEPGKGAVFKVYLPEVDAPASSLNRRSDDLSVVTGTETILLVEDDDSIRALAWNILKRYGYLVIEAASGESALELSAHYAGTIHLLITDLVMPGRSGSEVAHVLQTRRPAMKVLYVSGYTTEAVFRHGLLAGKTAFLPKPFTPDALARKVRSVLDEIRNATPGAIVAARASEETHDA